MDEREFQDLLAEKTAEAQRIIASFLPPEEGQQQYVIEAMNYSMNAGGKRLRPILMHSTCRLFGGEEQLVYPFMAAMEMIHTHSLVHDDLPAIDNDLYRRGRKTTWAVYGDSMAVLAGDGLLNLAYETAAEAFRLRPGDMNVEKAFVILAGKTGIRGMTGGQSVDVQMDGKPLSEDLLTFIYTLKTGALLEASLMIGAQLGGAGDENVRKLEQIGRSIGMAFQIRDDILDVSGDEKLLGKPVGSDARNRKTTYVTLFGLEKAQEETERLTGEALRLLSEITGSGSCVSQTEAAFLKELLLSLAYRDH